MAFALKYDPAGMTPVDIDQGDFDSATEIRISERASLSEVTKRLVDWQTEWLSAT